MTEGDTAPTSLTPIDFTAYPPSPVIFAYNAVDILCDPLGCSEWRQWLPHRFTTEGAWLSEEHVVHQSIFTLFPPMMTYKEFLTQNEGKAGEIGAPPYSWQSIRTYAFETPSTSLAVLTTNTSMLTLMALVLCIRRLKAWLIPFFCGLGRQAARRTHGTEWEQSNEIRITKFGEYVFRLVFHSALSLAGIYLFWDEPWWAWLVPSSTSSSAAVGTKSLFLDYPFQPVEPSMIWYYLIQAAYNIEAIVCLLELSLEVILQPLANPHTHQWQWPIGVKWSRTVRGDFREMLVHHIVTNMLVMGSSFFRFTRVGSMVFMVHDISDVPVDLSKLANFLKWKATTVVCFIALVVMWLLTRLIVLPFVIYRSVLFETWLVCANGAVRPIYFAMYQPVFVVLIGLLIFLHFVWFTMFIRMGYVLVRKGEAHDFSENKKGEHSGGASSNGAVLNGNKKCN